MAFKSILAYLCLSACSHGWSLLTDSCRACVMVAKSGAEQEQRLVKPRRFLASQMSLAQWQLISPLFHLWGIKINLGSLFGWCTVNCWSRSQQMAVSDPGSWGPAHSAGTALEGVLVVALCFSPGRISFVPLVSAWWSGWGHHALAGLPGGRHKPLHVADHLCSGTVTHRTQHQLCRHLPLCRMTSDSAQLGVTFCFWLCEGHLGICKGQGELCHGIEAMWCAGQHCAFLACMMVTPICSNCSVGLQKIATSAYLIASLPRGWFLEN